MYHRFRLLLLAAGSMAAVTLRAASPSPHGEHAATPEASAAKCEVLTETPPVAGRQATAVVRLTGSDGKPLTLDQLQVAHTEKLHLLIVDGTLTDYHHEHPVASDKPGEYRFEFSPRYGGPYHIWADVVPTATSRQEYAKTTVMVQGSPAEKNKALNTTADADGYRFRLTSENNEPLQAGKATMVKVKVTTPDGKDFTALEPLMGAYAHMVAFPENLESVTHVHPMGEEPQAATERGGPELSFHVEPEKPGFQKLFLQTQIGAREFYAAFGVEVKAASESAASPGGQFTCPMHPEVKQKTPGKCPKCGTALAPTKIDSEKKHDHQH